MRLLTWLSRNLLRVGSASSPARVGEVAQHPAAKLIPPELRPYLENYNISNIRYPPYQQGYPGLVPGEWFMRTYQKELLDRIEGSIGMPESEFKLYLEPVIVGFSELAHMLPASENHHHSGPGGLIRHCLEVAALTLDGCLTTQFDYDETPAQRSMRLRRWYVAGVIAGLLHDAGKPLSDITAMDFNGEHQWFYGADSLHEWATRFGLERYFLHWNAKRHGNHVQVSVSLVTDLVPRETRRWLLEGGHDIYEQMLDAIAGAGEGSLTKLVRWADCASVERDLKRGAREGSSGDTGVPVTRLVIDAMLRLISDGKWKVNEAGGRVWTTIEGVFVAWNYGAEEVVNLIVKDGMPIPRSADTLAATLINHDLIERAAGGDVYWLVTPHLMRKNGKAPALRCIKLSSPDILFPVSPVPPPVSVSLGKEGQQSDLIAPNDYRGASASAGEIAGVDQQGAVPAAQDGSAASAGAGAGAAKPARKKKSGGTTQQQSPLPGAASAGITLAPNPAASVAPAEAPASTVEPIPTPEAEPEQEGYDLLDQILSVMPDAQQTQPEEGGEENAAAEPEAPPPPALSLEEMLLGLTPYVPPQPQEVEAVPAAEEEPEPEPAAAAEPEVSMTGEGAPTAAQVILVADQPSDEPADEVQSEVVAIAVGMGRAEKISLSELMGIPSPNPQPSKPEPSAPEPVVVKVDTPAAPARGWVLPEEVATKLTTREQSLLRAQPALAPKLLQGIESGNGKVRNVYNKVFIGFRDSGFEESDLPAMLEAGWVWQDFLAEGDGLTRTLQLIYGFVFSQDISRIFVKLAGITDLYVPSEDDFSPQELDHLASCIPDLIGAATLENFAETPLWSITPGLLASIAEQKGIKPIMLENALYVLRDAIKQSVRKRIFIRALSEELKQK